MRRQDLGYALRVCAAARLEGGLERLQVADAPPRGVDTGRRQVGDQRRAPELGS